MPSGSNPSQTRNRTHNDHVKGRVEHAGDPCLADDQAVLVGQVVDEHTQVEVDRLLLGELGALYEFSQDSPRRPLTLLHVALLGALGDLVPVHVEFDVVGIG
jgi:hypothetical protein